MSFRGAPLRRTRNPEPWHGVWIPGPRARARPGMTGRACEEPQGGQRRACAVPTIQPHRRHPEVLAASCGEPRRMAPGTVLAAILRDAAQWRGPQDDGGVWAIKVGG